MGGFVLNLNKREFPTREALRQFAKQIPAINVSAVELLLQFLQTSFEIQHYIFDILEKKYKLSEGKLMVMIILYQSSNGIAPSKLAEKACVTRATISAMLHRMIRDGLACSFSNSTDGRAKVVALTEKGRVFMDEILPEHFLRTARLMNNLTEEEQIQLVQLLKKIKGN
ncbi:MAG: transcription regulator [Pelosinus sp.]|jgi:DNA-binding MarR family transcriptional regulator|nr:transcription regulator [Pelosinus sp.]